MKRIKKLGKKYGKLDVLSEATIDGRRHALVQCKCGVQKYTLVDALTAGRTRSCGAHACKATHSSVKARKGFKPRGRRLGSGGVAPATLQKIWKMAYHPTAPTSIALAARKYGVEVNQTLYSALRSVRLAGGIDKYMAQVGQ